MCRVVCVMAATVPCAVRCYFQLSQNFFYRLRTVISEPVAYDADSEFMSLLCTNHHTYSNLTLKDHLKMCGLFAQSSGASGDAVMGDRSPVTEIC